MSEALTAQSQTVFFKPVRQIGFIIPDCTIEERHTDRLQITQQPVEIGAVISDHAFLLPFEVSVRYAWSDSATATQNWSQINYQRLQQLQQSRMPFDLVTGKRMYQSMLLSEMEVTTDQHTENALFVEAHCQAIIIVSTSSVPATPQSDQALAPSTASQVNAGPQQLSETNSVPTISGISGAGP